jgi:hypothetical protein
MQAAYVDECLNAYERPYRRDVRRAEQYFRNVLVDWLTAGRDCCFDTLATRLQVLQRFCGAEPT